MQPDTAAAKPGSPAAPPARGTILSGRFEVLRPLGRRTLLGRDDASAGSVVIRIVQGELVSDDEQARVESRVRELRGASGSSMAGPLYAGRDGGWFVVVTPFVHGVPLDERLGPDGLGVGPTLDVGRDLLRAVASAHEHGLERLEIRPSNVIVNPDGRVRSATLIGFASAILRDCLAGGESPLDVAYCAPERVGGLDRPVDRRADVYSVGLILHECLTGRPVHSGATEGELLRRRLTDPPSGLRSDHADLPAGVEAEILRMLEIEPARRPAGASEALAAIAGAGGGDRSAAGAERSTGRGATAAVGQPAGGRDREHELGVLVDAVDRASAGLGGTVLVEGTAGRGKTSLLDALAERAAADGAIVLRGRVGERPFAPAAGLEGMPDIVERQARVDPACASRLLGVGDAAGRAAVCRLLPVLSATLAGHWQSGSAPAGRWSRARTLGETLAAVGSEGRPAVIVIDDCQWADQATVDLITTWSTDAGAGGAGGAARHAVLVAAYRPELVGADHPLRELAAVRRIRLGRPGWPVGPAVGFDQLPEDVRKLLCGAAVVGREFDPVVAGAILGRGDTWRNLTVADAERRGAIARGGDGRQTVVFTSDELHRAAVDSLSVGERRRLHGRAVDALAAIAGDHVYEIADQAISSGDPERATRRALAAGRAAVGRGADDVGERYFGEAHRYAADGAPELELEIAEGLAATQLARGRADLAAEQLGEAARIAREPGRRAAITATLAGIEAARGDPKAAIGAAEAAVADLGGRIASRGPALVAAIVCEILSRAFRTLRRRPRGQQIERQAAVYNLLAGLYAQADRRLAGWWAQLRGLRLAESQRPGQVLVEGLSAYARLLCDARLRLAASTIARRALAEAEALGDDRLTGGALTMEGELLYAAGNPRSAAARFGEAAILLGGGGGVSDQDRSAEAAAGRDRAVLGRGYCEYRLGRLEDARATAAELGARAAGSDRPELGWAARGLWLKAADGADGGGLVRPAAGETIEFEVEREARGLELLGSVRASAAADVLSRAGDGRGAKGGRAGDGRTGVDEPDIRMAAAETRASSAVWLVSALRQAIEADATRDEPADASRTREARRAGRRGLREARRRRTNLPQALRELGLVETLGGRRRLGRRLLRRSLRVSVRQSAREEHALT
ncbi:MAG TPA: AAA family ATPase, partial [Solirubrobacteraceae bacterium]|nr:AAA family ATPase [Solirubrobacteraceae bacterium]